MSIMTHWFSFDPNLHLIKLQPNLSQYFFPFLVAGIRKCTSRFYSSGVQRRRDAPVVLVLRVQLKPRDLIQ
jgi:hypothetical protein